ncbi:MAG: four-carbon acid sugar kinase family protein [Dysgonamonadaceae bacterium]|jgi:uncharacterized protein YgbK (DUF1537 family)|nr:four-carbon acid sugar kinase family protein [Dysgonamonadaceae bacterium]
MITVLADDITGAAEIAGVCLRYGLKVIFDFDFGLKQIPETDVWIIASDTRSMPEAGACERVGEVASFLFCRCGLDPQTHFIFKKIDSALRGHVIPEIETLLKYIHRKQTYILPANPEYGRIIRDGVYYINEKTLVETSFADDPDFPAKSSLVKEIVHLPDNEKFILPDILSEKDYFDYAKQLTSDILPVGASIFFEACLQTRFPLARKVERKMMDFGENILMICGSTHETSREFIHNMNNYSLVEIAINEIDTLLSDSEIFIKRIKYALDKYDSQKRLIVCVERKKASPAVSGKIKYLLAKISKYLLENAHIEELYIEGGATAYACFQANGFLSLIPVHEYARGVVRMKIIEKENLYVTIKPGSYVWPEKII